MESRPHGKRKRDEDLLEDLGTSGSTLVESIFVQSDDGFNVPAPEEPEAFSEGRYGEFLDPDFPPCASSIDGKKKSASE